MACDNNLVQLRVIMRQNIYFLIIPFGGGAAGLPHSRVLTVLNTFCRRVTIAQRHGADCQQNKSQNFHSDINVKSEYAGNDRMSGGGKSNPGGCATALASMAD